jgi:GNAT superfamily N-acetyltransferase
MTADLIPGSPLADEICLRDGLTVTFSSVTAEDESAIVDFLIRLSPDSRRLRFFSAAIDLRVEAHREMSGDAVDHHGLLARMGVRVVGHAIFVRMPQTARAEVAVEVADDLHHLGLATQLMIRLAQAAEERHITQFFAEVLPENRDMLAVFHDGFDTASVNGPDAIEVEFPTSGWRAAHARFH